MEGKKEEKNELNEEEEFLKNSDPLSKRNYLEGKLNEISTKFIDNHYKELFGEDAPSLLDELQGLLLEEIAKCQMPVEYTVSLFHFHCSGEDLIHAFSSSPIHEEMDIKLEIVKRNGINNLIVTIYVFATK